MRSRGSYVGNAELIPRYLAAVPLTGYLLPLTVPGWECGRLRESVSEHLSAESRAKALLREMLSENQYQQLIKFGYLEVTSPSIENRIYRIPGAGGLVKVYERGCAVMELCLQPAEPLPDGDVVVMHKLMIEGNEQEYLQKANHFAPGIISLRCQHL